MPVSFLFFNHLVLSFSLLFQFGFVSLLVRYFMNGFCVIINNSC